MSQLLSCQLPQVQEHNSSLMDALSIGNQSQMADSVVPPLEQGWISQPRSTISLPPAPQDLDSSTVIRPPQRRAATSARYNIKTAWWPLDDYLSDSSGRSTPAYDVRTEHEGDSHVENNKRLSWVRRRKRDVTSDDDSDSDEYKDDGEEEDEPLMSGSKRKRVAGDKTANPRKKRKLFRRSRASSKLGFSRAEISRLVNFLALETDWQIVAQYVFEHTKVLRTHSQTGRDEDELKPSLESLNFNDAQNANRLKNLWRDVLSKQIINLYKE